MEPVIIIGVTMIWIVAIILLILASFGYGLKSRGFATEHSAITALPMSGITVKDYRSRRGDHPVIDESLAKRSKTFSYLSVIAAVLLIVFLILSVFL